MQMQASQISPVSCEYKQPVLMGGFCNRLTDHTVAMQGRQHACSKQNISEWALTSPVHVAAGTELDEDEELDDEDEELDDEDEEAPLEADELFDSEELDGELSSDGDGELFELLDGEGECFGDGECLLSGEGESEAASSFVDEEQSMNLQDVLYTPP